MEREEERLSMGGKSFVEGEWERLLVNDVKKSEQILTSRVGICPKVEEYNH